MVKPKIILKLEMMDTPKTILKVEIYLQKFEILEKMEILVKIEILVKNRSCDLNEIET